MCLSALAMGAGTAAAARVQAAGTQPAVAGLAGAADTRAQRLASLRASLRDLHRAADRSVAKPANPFLRLGFTVSVVGTKVEIVFASSSRDLAGEAKLAQRVLTREIRRVHAAWRAADATPEVNAIVRQLNELTADAARASGKRTNAEIGAFKKAHLADVKYAGRRWIVDREIGRQGAVIISCGVRNARLRRVIEQMYRRGASVGDGGTATSCSMRSGRAVAPPIASISSRPPNAEPGS